MAISFPLNPTVGDVFTQNGRSWQWDGATWGSYGTVDDPGALKVDPSNDRVGIGLGSATPSYTLDVSGDARVSSDFIVGGTAYVDTVNGRVGIGTNSPTVPLDVVGDLTAATAVGDDYLQIKFQADDTALYTSLASSSSMEGAEVSLFAQNPSTEAAVRLSIDGDPVTITNLTGAGAVDFTLAESVTLDGSITDYGTSIALNSGDNQLLTKLFTDGSTWGEVRAWDTNTESNIELYLGGSTVYINNDVDAGSGTMFVDSTNNRVGINDTTPSYTLDVNGDINTTSDIRVGGVAINSNLVTGATYYFTDNSQYAPEYGSNYYRTALYTVSAPSGKSISSVQLTVRSSAPAWVTITAQSSSSYSYYVWSKGASTGYVNYFLDCR